VVHDWKHAGNRCVKSKPYTLIPKCWNYRESETAEKQNASKKWSCSPSVEISGHIRVHPWKKNILKYAVQHVFSNFRNSVFTHWSLTTSKKSISQHAHFNFVLPLQRPSSDQVPHSKTTVLYERNAPMHSHFIAPLDGTVPCQQVFIQKAVSEFLCRKRNKKTDTCNGQMIL